uniref:Uncharacterized protein LOC102808671 n=1 Tax=Saccoglossus kowalevskii TaxID=10224 RepID=A0ABM0MGT6_SACKO|nr:PREDICTED: uncharacterized protein LOC102808671 [Saccoglossus kowalevskii]
MGIQYLFGFVELNIDEHMTLPDYAANLYWFKEGTHVLPENIVISEDGHQLLIESFEEVDYGIITCVVYSEENYFIGKRRFQLGREIEIFTLSPVNPREIYRSIGSTVSFEVRIVGFFDPDDIKWHKGLSVIDGEENSRVELTNDAQNLTISHIVKKDYGSYTCSLLNSDSMEVKVEFQLAQPVFDHYDDIAHYWDFEMIRNQDDKVVYLDKITHKMSEGSCARGGEGVVGNSVHLNTQENCKGYLKIVENELSEECFTEPDNCMDGFSFSLWVNLISTTSPGQAFLICSKPRGLCGTCQSSSNTFTCSMTLTTIDMKWDVPRFELSKNTWHNILVSWDPIGEMRVYLDANVEGSVFPTESERGSYDDSAHVVYLGSDDTEQPATHLIGLFDEFVIWYQRVISQKEVATMFLQVRGMGPYSLDEDVTYVFTVEQLDEMLTFFCPFDIPRIFRSHLYWVQNNEILAEYRGRTIIRMSAESVSVHNVTCQYFSGSHLISSDAFTAKLNGDEDTGISFHAKVDSAEEMEHEDREHDKQILDHMANAQPNENLDIYYEIPCASYPCQNGGTCEIIDHRYLVGEEEKHDYSYKCLCVDGFLGINCQRVRSACDVNDPCFNGRCVPDEENVKPTCFCLPGYQGDTCNEAEEVKIKLQDPSVCTQYMEGSKKCRIVTNDIGSCDVEIEVVVTGHYMTQQIKWFHYFAKLNRTRVHSTQVSI